MRGKGGKRREGEGRGGREEYTLRRKRGRDGRREGGKEGYTEEGNGGLNEGGKEGRREGEKEERGVAGRE